MLFKGSGELVVTGSESESDNGSDDDSDDGSDDGSDSNVDEYIGSALVNDSLVATESFCSL